MVVTYAHFVIVSKMYANNVRGQILFDSFTRLIVMFVTAEKISVLVLCLIGFFLTFFHSFKSSLIYTSPIKWHENS